MDYHRIVEDAIEKHKVLPIDMLGIGATGEYAYLNSHKDSYIRTVRDVDNLCQSERRSSRHILEIGSFLGPVSISLRRMGYSVSALDIPGVL